jgi:hypothetical protein
MKRSPHTQVRALLGLYKMEQLVKEQDVSKRKRDPATLERLVDALNQLKEDNERLNEENEALRNKVGKR